MMAKKEVHYDQYISIIMYSTSNRSSKSQAWFSGCSSTISSKGNLQTCCGPYLILPRLFGTQASGAHVNA